MRPYPRVLLFAGAAVLLYDALASFASVQWGLDYGSSWMVVGSFLLYAAAGFAGARVQRGILPGATAGTVAGLVDSTLGWLLSSLIGAGRGDAETGPAALAAVVLVVTLMGGACGWAGALLGRRR